MEMDMKEQRRQEPTKAMDEVAVGGSSLDKRNEKRRTRSGRICYALDVVFSVFLLAILSPLIRVFSILSIFGSPGAVSDCVQEHVGKNGKLSCFYKLQSMVPSAEKQIHKRLGKNKTDYYIFRIKTLIYIT